MNRNKKFVFIKDKGWWFKDPSNYWLHVIPLSDRLERAVIDILIRRTKIKFDELLSEIYEKFTNALTPARKDIREILQEYAEEDKKHPGEWMLKPAIKIHVRKHTELILKLANIGQKLGFDVWIGKKEQGEKVRTERLFKYISDKYKGGLNLGFEDKFLRNIENIDVLWIKNDIPIYAFEIEYSTAVTEAIRRLKILIIAARERELSAPTCVIAIPKERDRRLIKKLNDLKLIGMITEDDTKTLKKLFIDEIYDY